jgi:hypothetical protein
MPNLVAPAQPDFQHASSAHRRSFAERYSLLNAIQTTKMSPAIIFALALLTLAVGQTKAFAIQRIQGPASPSMLLTTPNGWLFDFTVLDVASLEIPVHSPTLGWINKNVKRIPYHPHHLSAKSSVDKVFSYTLNVYYKGSQSVSDPLNPSSNLKSDCIIALPLESHQSSRLRSWFHSVDSASATATKDEGNTPSWVGNSIKSSLKIAKASPQIGDDHLEMLDKMKRNSQWLTNREATQDQPSVKKVGCLDPKVGFIIPELLF